MLEYDSQQSALVVMHVGNHTCQAKMPKVDQAVILKAVSQNTGVKPNKLINDQMVQLMTNESIDWNGIEKLLENLLM